MIMAASERSEVVLLSISAFLFLIGVISALLALYLHLKHPKPRGQAEAIPWIGKGFDSTGVAPRLSALRRDYLHELRSRQGSGSHSHSPDRIAAARKLVARLSYFGS